MEIFFNETKMFLLTYKIEILIFIISLVILFILYLMRSKSIVKKLIIEVISESEEYLNNEKGQAKIDLIEIKLKEKINLLPFYLKVFINKFITKYYIVTVIEKLLNTVQDAFDPNAEDVDIKGNEEIKKKE